MSHSAYIVYMKAKDIHTGEVAYRHFAVTGATEAAAVDKARVKMHTLYPAGNYAVTLDKVQRKGKF